MDEEKKRKVMLGVVIGCFSLAMILFLTTSGIFKKKYKGSNEPIVMLCVNPECNADFDLERDDYRDQMSQIPMMMMMESTPPLECTSCNKRSAFRATVCESCDSLFLPTPSSDDFPDRCPECGYSKIEERRNSAN